MAWQVEQVRPLGTITPTTSGSVSTWGVSGNGVVLISFQLPSLASLEVVVGPEEDGKNISVLSVQTNGDFIFSSDTGGQVFVTPVTGTGYKSLSFDNTTGSVYNVGIWIHATNAGTAIGSVPVYYACHNYNQYYILNTENITVTKSTGTVMINQTGLNLCFKREVQKIAATIPAQCVATFYSGNVNVVTNANVDVYGYLNGTSVNISESTGTPTSYSMSDDNSQGNGQWRFTYTNTTNSAVTVYLYSRDSSNVNRYATIYYYGEAINSGSSGWSLSPTVYSKVIPKFHGVSTTTVSVTCAAGQVARIPLEIPAYSSIRIYSVTTGNTDVYGYVSSTQQDVNSSTGAPLVSTDIVTQDDDGNGNRQYNMTVVGGALNVVNYIYHRCYSQTATCNSTIYVVCTLPCYKLASGYSYWNGGSTYHPVWMSGKASTKNTTVNPATVTSITFQTAAYTGSYSASWDCSDDADGSLMAYANGTTITVSALGRSSYIYGGAHLLLCDNMTACTTITGCNIINLEDVTSLSNCFTTSGLIAVPAGVADWNVSTVLDFQGVFWNCPALQQIELHWTTISGTNFQGCFGYCNNLLKLIIYYFDTTHATNMTYFLAGCEKLWYIYIGPNYRMNGAGSASGGEFPNQSASANFPAPTDCIVNGRWRNIATGVTYLYNAIPTTAGYAQYSCHIPDGRPTLATYVEGTTSYGYTVNINGSNTGMVTWLYKGHAAGIPYSTLYNITTITSYDTYTPDGTEDGSWDASMYGDGKVHCYLKGTNIIIAGNGSGYIDVAMRGVQMFCNLPYLTDVIIPHLNYYKDSNNVMKTSGTTYPFAFCPNIEKIDISGLDFANVGNYYWHFFVYSRTSSSGVYTTTMLTKLAWLKVGAGCQRINLSPLPIPTSGVTAAPSGATIDGHWYDEALNAYDPGSYASDGTVTASTIPYRAAHTYTAYLPTPPSTWSLGNTYTLSSFASSGTSTRTVNVTCGMGQVARINISMPAYSSFTLSVSTTDNVDVYGYLVTSAVDVDSATGAPLSNITGSDDNTGGNGQWRMTYSTTTNSRSYYIYHRCNSLSDTCNSVISVTCTVSQWTILDGYSMPALQPYGTSTASVSVSCAAMQTARIPIVVPANSTVVLSSSGTTIDTYGYLNGSSVNINTSTGAPVSYIYYNDDYNGSNQWHIEYTNGTSANQTLYIYHRSYNGTQANTATITAECTGPEPPPSSNVWKVYTGTEWVEVKPQLYNGTEWVNTIGTLYDSSEWI